MLSKHKWRNFSLINPVWQEVFDNQDRIKKDTVVEVWKGENAEWGRTMAKVNYCFKLLKMVEYCAVLRE